MFRLHQRHSKTIGKPLHHVDGYALKSSQSVRAAIIAAIATVLLLNVLWMISASLLNRVFPWFVIVQGIFLGLAVRRWGRGFDWRFPVIAVVAAIIGAYGGNLLLAADTAADEFGTNPLHILMNMSERTMGIYFEEVVSAIDHVYAFCAAAIAAFLAQRRLTRAQEYAIRTIGREKPLS